MIQRLVCEKQNQKEGKGRKEEGEREGLGEEEEGRNLQLFPIKPKCLNLATMLPDLL